VEIQESKPQAVPYNANVALSPNPLLTMAARPNAQPASAIRWQRGYLDAKYDASQATSQKTLGCQFNEKYDVKKVRNI
jgi:hypothetical protein